MLEFLIKLLGGSNEQKIKNIAGIIDHINALEPEFEALTDDELKAKTPYLVLLLQPYCMHTSVS